MCLIKFPNLLKLNILLKNTHLQNYASELIKFYSKTFISYFLYDIININWNLLLKKYSNKVDNNLFLIIIVYLKINEILRN